MQKLSSTWKQQKQIRTRQEAQKYFKPSSTSTSVKGLATDSNPTAAIPTKSLDQHAVSVGASCLKLIGCSNKQLTNRDEDETNRRKAIGQGGPEKACRRSPRLKGQRRAREVQEGIIPVPLTASKQTLTHREEGQLGCTFNSSFSGDLDDDLLQAMEAAEANYCHQHQQTETEATGNTGAPLQAVDVTETTMETGEGTGRPHSVCSLVHKPHNEMETSPNAAAPFEEFQNCKDLFTEIRPSNFGEGIKLAVTNSTDGSNKSQQIHQSSRTFAKMNYSSFDVQQQSKEIKMPVGSERPSINKGTNSSAILNEWTLNNDKTNNSGLGKPARNFMDSCMTAEKENSPAGLVYCMDSQSQTESSNDRQIEQTGNYQQHFLDQRDKITSGEQYRMTNKRQSGRTRENTPKQIPARIDTSNDSSAHAKSIAERETSQQDPEVSRHDAVSPAASTNPPIRPTGDPLLLSSWGLPEQVLAQYHRCHVIRMFPWQAQCLALGRVLDGGNLVYSAPTSGGKTLVAELLILKRVLETKKKALLILPFVSVAREKMFYLQGMFQDAGVRVGGYMGSESPTGGFQTVDVAVCTIEKANSLVNRLLEENKVDQLGIIVVDELHMVGDSHRGYLLELLLTKIRYIMKKTQDATRTTRTDNMENLMTPTFQNSIQIVGMSATLPNLDHLAKWLDADLYHTDFRPVPLTQTLKVGGAIYNSALTKLRDFKPLHAIPGDEDQILSLCLETLAIGCSVLIFCPTKNWCEKLCENMAREIARLTGMIPSRSRDDGVSINLNKQSLQDVVEQLKRIPVGLDPVLRRTVPCGVAYHHAGLSFDERDIIEGAFRQSAIRILVATSTLSSGVNLPARRVIIRSVMFNRRVLDPLVYRQMSGRAGRKGVDTEGESILICKPSERDKAANLMQAPVPPVQSCLKKQGQDLSNSMKRAILEVIASGAASSPEEVGHYAGCTLLAVGLEAGPTDQESTGAEGENSTSAAIDKCVQFLQDQEFIILQTVKITDESKEVFRPTQLGTATLASALSPDEALVVFSELQRARKNFVLENDLHLLYQVTPIYDQGFQPDWYEFMCTWENLSTDKRHVAELVGVEERFLIRAAQGALSTHNAKLQHALAVHKRFYTTLILNDLVREMPVIVAARKYSCARGQLQSLQQSAATFAGMVTSFCSKLGWTSLELLLGQFQSRLTFGVQRELCDLVRISLLNAFRARLLYNSGFGSVAAVAAAKPSDIEGVLRKAVPFQSSRKAIDEQQFEVDERKQSRCIWATGRKGLTEQQAALLIVQEAKDLLQADLGALGVEWKPREVPPSSRSGDDADDRKGRIRESTSRLQPPNANCKESLSSSRSGDDVENHREMRAPPSKIQPPNTKCTTSNQHPAVVGSNLNHENKSTSGSLPKYQKTSGVNQIQDKSRVLQLSCQLPKTNHNKSLNLKSVLKSKVIVDDKSASNSQQGGRNTTRAFPRVNEIEEDAKDSASRVQPLSIESNDGHLGIANSTTDLQKEFPRHQQIEGLVGTFQHNRPLPSPSLVAKMATDGRSFENETQVSSEKNVRFVSAESTTHENPKKGNMSNLESSITHRTKTNKDSENVLMAIDSAANCQGDVDTRPMLCKSSNCCTEENRLSSFAMNSNLEIKCSREQLHQGSRSFSIRTDTHRNKYGSNSEKKPSEKQQLDGGDEMTSDTSDALRDVLTMPVVGASGRGRTLTVEADVHIDASSSCRATAPDISSTKNLKNSPKINSKTQQISIQPSAKKSASIPNQLDCDPINPSSSQQQIISVCEISKNKVASSQDQASRCVTKDQEMKYLTTPTAAQHKNSLIVQETSPELFSLPVSPVNETEAAATDSGTDAPVNKNQLSPRNMTPISPVFSPLDSQMLQFLEQQEQAHCPQKTAAVGHNVHPLDNEVSTSDKQMLEKPSPVAVIKRYLGQDSQASSVFPLDPEVLRLKDGYQDADSMKEQQVLPVEERYEIISSPQTQQSSPSYSPLDSQALLFNDSITSELHPSQGQKSVAVASVEDLEFTSFFPTLNSQVLKVVDGFYTTRNELAAESASPALKSHSKSRTFEQCTNKKTSLRSTQKKTILKGRSCSRKKKKLVLTFCQSESPYSEFFLDEEITLDLAETLECSFVIDQNERTTQPSLNHQPGKTNARYLALINSRKKSSSMINAECSASTNQVKVESPVYSQLEADLALAAEWGDFFSFDEGHQEAVNLPPESNHIQDVKVDISNFVEKCETMYERGKDKLMSLNCHSHTKTVPVVQSSTEICNVETPQKILRSTTKNAKSAPTGKNKESKKVTPGEDLVQDSVDEYFNDHLSPGTVEMLDLFAGDSFSKTSSRAAKTASVAYTSKSKDTRNATSKSTRNSTKNSTSSVVPNPTSATNFDRKSLIHKHIDDQGRSAELVLKSDCKMTKQPKEQQRKRRSSERISNLVQEDIPTKKVHQELFQERSPLVNDGENSETPDARRKSDGDLISPTPPKEKSNTPKLLKGTPKQRPQLDVSIKADTPRSLCLRERSTALHKQATKANLNVVRSLENEQITSSQRKRKSHRSNSPFSLKLVSSPLSTSQLDSPMQLQYDLNAAQGESQLHLNLDSESSFEIEPPPPRRGKPTSAKPLRVSPRHLSARNDPPTAPIQQASPKVASTQGAFTIIDVCSSRELFQTFLKEWSSKSWYSLSVACERYQPPVQGGGIGGNIRKAVPRPNKSDTVDGFRVGDESLVVTGLSICWEDKDAYFISLQKEISDFDPDDSLAQPPLDPTLSIHQRLQAVKTNLETDKFVTGNRTQGVSKLVFDCKEHYKVLSRGCGISLSGALADPKVAHWLIDPGAKERNLQGLVTHYIPQEGHILEGISGGIGLGSLGLIAQDPGTGRLRAATESVLVLALMDHLEPVLHEGGLYKAFAEVEMPCMQVLARMELTGFGFSQNECETQKAVMQTKLTALEEQAYQIAGHGFSLTSPEDIARVLYVELKLPPNGDPTQASTAALRKTLGGRGSRPRLPKHFSTCKDSLEKLRPFHPLPGIVLEWRRITAAVTKVVFPLLKERRAEPKLGGERIYAFCQTHTATGRVCLSDPNIQAIPRDFEIEMPSAIGESPPLGASVPTGLSYSTRAKTRQAQGRGQQGRGARMAQDGCEPGPSCAVSLRHAFCPFQGGILLAADYSQLELRILAHLSGDYKLAGVLNGGEDVFKCIAAQWRQIDEGQVTPKQRQQAKQICYGMVYGIGAKALGQQLGESEEDAAAFMESFRTQYKGMKKYIRATVDQCRANGFVETILHRKRFLPAITHSNPAARSQAERQAVNTTIQGSAADLVKVAMVNIDRRLKEEFPNTKVTHRHREDFELGLTQRRKSRRCTATTPSGAFLVLQLHDELIYEVHREDLIQVAQLVKVEMESAIKLNVRLPVKVKVGPTWGSMEDLDL